MSGGSPLKFGDGGEGNELESVSRVWTSRTQLFEGRLAFNPGLSLTRVSFSFVQKNFLR